MVVYLGGDKRVEKGKDYNGLAMALEDVSNTKISSSLWKWCSNETDTKHYSTATRQQNMLENLLDGEAMTSRLNEEQFIAARAAAQFSSAEVKWYSPDFDKFTNWFLPSIGQWILAMKGTGAIWNGNKFTGNSNIKSQYGLSGLSLLYGASPEGAYLTTSEQYRDSVYTMYMNANLDKINIQRAEKTQATAQIRPFIAFKYDNGGTQDPQEVLDCHVFDPTVGMVMTSTGRFYRNASYADKAKEQSIAVVAYVATDRNETIETGKNYKGLAIGINDNLGRWADSGWLEKNKGKNNVPATTKIEEAIAMKNGIAVSTELEKVQNENKQTYPNLFLAVNSMIATDRTYSYDRKEHTSGWFMPSLGQWMLVFKGQGLTFTNTEDFNKNLKTAWKKVNDMFNNAGVDKMQDNPFFTTTQYTSKEGENLKIWGFTPQDGIKTLDANENSSTRCFIAF